MNPKNMNTIITRSFLLAAAAVVLLFVSITPIFGQKEQAERATTRDALTQTGFMTGPEVSDDLDGNDDEYFYKFQAGPGKLTVTLEVTANETNAGAMLDLFSGSKPILSNMLVQGADGGSESVTKSVNLTKAQDIIIRIKGLRYGSSAGYPGTYKIRLEGPATRFKDVVPAAEGTGQPEMSSTSGIDQNIKPDVQQADATGEGKAPEVPQSARADPDKVPEVPQSAGSGEDKKPEVDPSTETVPGKKPDAVDRAIEKGKTKTKKVLDILNTIKTKIPD